MSDMPKTIWVHNNSAGQQEAIWKRESKGKYDTQYTNTEQLKAAIEGMREDDSVTSAPNGEVLQEASIAAGHYNAALDEVLKILEG